MPNEIVPRSPSRLTSVSVSYAAFFDEFLDRFRQSTQDSYTFDLLDFERFVRQPSTPAALEVLLSNGHGAANRIAIAYLAHLRHRRLSAATINRRLSTLRSVVTHARKVGVVAFALDVDGLKDRPYRDTAGPGLEGWRAIKSKSCELASTPDGPGRRPSAARDKRNLALIRLMHDIGLRRGECVSLDLADAELDKSRVMVIGKGKTEKEAITLPDPTRDAVADWIAVRGREPGPLFTRCDPGSLGLQRMTGESVNRMVKRLSRQAGLTRDTRAHGLRHQAITRLAEKTNGNVMKMRKFSRHAKVETLLLYDDSRRDDAGELAKLLANDE